MASKARRGAKSVPARAAKAKSAAQRPRKGKAAPARKGKAAARTAAARKAPARKPAVRKPARAARKAPAREPAHGGRAARSVAAPAVARSPAAGNGARDGVRNGALSRNVKRLARLDMPGGGQVVVQGNYAYIGHMEAPHGTTIVNVSDPRKPRVVARIPQADPHSHSHKVRVAGDLMIVNSEMADRHHLRRGWLIPETTAHLARELGRTPNDAELAKALGVGVAELPALRAAQRRGYPNPGFKLYDVSDPTHPRLLHFEKTWGVGVHRFDMDERYAYISTEKDGFHGNILCIYDLANPARPEPVSDWWMPGQHLAAGDKPDWRGYRNRLHHGMRSGDRIYAACWHAGFYVLDVSDIRHPRAIAHHTYHPPVVEPTHTVMPLPQRVNGRQLAVAIDEEHDHIVGQPHAMLWVFDITDLGDIRPLSNYTVGEADSPWSRKGKRFGAHQFQEHLERNVIAVTWFSGGVRFVDLSDPLAPREAGYFIPEPGKGQRVPQSNDVEVDARGLVYVIDRLNGFDVLEFAGA